MPQAGCICRKFRVGRVPGLFDGFGCRLLGLLGGEGFKLLKPFRMVVSEQKNEIAGASKQAIL